MSRAQEIPHFNYEKVITAPTSKLWHQTFRDELLGYPTLQAAQSSKSAGQERRPVMGRWRKIMNISYVLGTDYGSRGVNVSLIFSSWRISAMNLMWRENGTEECEGQQKLLVLCPYLLGSFVFWSTQIPLVPSLATASTPITWFEGCPWAAGTYLICAHWKVKLSGELGPPRGSP